mgnify:CR=1 FL=1
MGVLLLAMLAFRPRLHQDNRFAINLANRLVKLVTVTWAVWSLSTGSVVAQFTAQLNGGDNGGQCAASSFSGSFGCRGGGSGGNGSGSGGGGFEDACHGGFAGATLSTSADGVGMPDLWFVSLSIMRTLASLPGIWVSHAVNFLLPFWVMVPLQVYTLGITFNVMAPTVCALAAQPPHIVLAARHECQGLRSVMNVAVLLSMPISFKAGGGAPDAGDGGPRDLLLLVLFTYTMLLLIIPCTVAYFVELSWKLSYVRRQRLQAGVRSDVGGIMLFDSPHAWVEMLYLGYVAVCIAWLACDAAVTLLPPITCETGGA